MEDDFMDEFFEYDMVMNDGKTFFGDGKKGGGCLTTTLVILFVVGLIIYLV